MRELIADLRPSLDAANEQLLTDDAPRAAEQPVRPSIQRGHLRLVR